LGAAFLFLFVFAAAVRGRRRCGRCRSTGRPWERSVRSQPRALAAGCRGRLPDTANRVLHALCLPRPRRPNGPNGNNICSGHGEGHWALDGRWEDHRRTDRAITSVRRTHTAGQSLHLTALPTPTWEQVHTSLHHTSCRHIAHVRALKRSPIFGRELALFCGLPPQLSLPIFVDAENSHSQPGPRPPAPRNEPAHAT
jgi:hypothetical protein